MGERSSKRTRSIHRALAAAVIRAAAIICAVTSLAACGGTRGLRPVPLGTSLDGDGGSLPAAWVQHHAFVEATIDGRGPVHLLLDTGASVLMLAPAVADRLGLDRVSLTGDGRGGLDVSGAHGASATVREVAPVSELRAGPLVVRDVDALLLHSAELDAAVGRPVDGVLPASAFLDVLLTIDYAAQRVSVSRGELPPADGAEILALRPRGLPHVTLDVGGAPCEILLDSGSTEFLSLPEDDAIRIGLRAPPAVTSRAATIGASAPVRKARLDGPVRWGRHVLTEPVVEIAPGKTGAAGASLLSEFRVTLDLPHARARFERAGADPIRCLPVRGLGFGIARRDGVWTVAYVLDGSPAGAAGIAVGDEVRTVEGLPAARVGQELFQVIVATSPVVRLVVARDGNDRTVTLPVATLVP